MLFINLVSGARWLPIWAPPGFAAPAAGAPPFFQADAGFWAAGAGGGLAFAPAIADFAALLNCLIAPDIGGAAGTPGTASGLRGRGFAGNGLFGGPGIFGNGLFCGLFGI
ncbi:MAG: hypothetical protein IT433_08065 [Phycisphaerales bacterium]|nr:hypothetical protein [Phycisphaerales bacterium]